MPTPSDAGRRALADDHRNAQGVAIHAAIHRAILRASQHAVVDASFDERVRFKNEIASDATATILAALRADPDRAARERDQSRFALGTRVRKIRGSSWQGVVVGHYGTSLTPDGVCVESEREPGSVQVYPAVALEEAPAADSAAGEREAAEQSDKARAYRPHPYDDLDAADREAKNLAKAANIPWREVKKIADVYYGPVARKLNRRDEQGDPAAGQEKRQGEGDGR